MNDLCESASAADIAAYRAESAIWLYVARLKPCGGQ
jgi:hypothetical protein